MGYFSNGTEGELYQHKYCNRCIHDQNEDCPIWFMHLVHNGSGGAIGDILNTFIPREGIYNEKCVMFIPKEKVNESVYCQRQ